MRFTGMSQAERRLSPRAKFTGLRSLLGQLDPATRAHSERVARLSVAFGRELGLAGSELRLLRDAGRLHDIGKLGLNQHILQKPAALSEAEFAEVRRHPQLGCELLGTHVKPRVLECILLHHERLDGRGYPFGITDYPLAVRVLQIADAWDALHNDRPYRKAQPAGAIRRMLHGSVNGCGFDMQLLDRFLKLTTTIFPDTDCTRRTGSTAWPLSLQPALAA